MTEKMAYSVSETAEALGVAPNTIYDMVAKRQIPFRKLGSRIIIPVPALIKWLETATENVRVPDPVLIEPAYAKPPFDPNTPASSESTSQRVLANSPGCGGRRNERRNSRVIIN